MDASEATKIVMSRIKRLDPENASRIMGAILLQEQGEKEMIRLAFGSEALLLSYVKQAKAVLGLPSNSPLPDPSNSFRPKNPFFQTSVPRILIPSDGFRLSNPSSPAASLPRSSPRPVSYAAVLNGTAINGSSSSSLPFYVNEFGEHGQVQDQLLFVDDSVGDPILSPSGRSDSFIFPYGEDVNGISSPHSSSFHRRSCSVNDASFLANLEEGVGGCGFGWRPCMYFSRGFCKNSSSCKFVHNDIGGGGEVIDVGSPSKNASGFDEFLRMKALQQQRFALMSSGCHHPYSYNKSMNFMSENQRFAAAAVLVGNDINEFSMSRPEMSDFSAMGQNGSASLSSRQIYLTFPADSTFKEEDVSNYFSNFGPVHDVRIPYQQKRMFGFVTFVHPETVKLILAKGNPHFVCESHVLVKPYKEKGKTLDKKQHQHLELGEYAASLSPSELDSREPFDVPFGPRMLLNSQEIILQRKLEQETELQHAVELQERRMMNLQLMDMKNQHHLHHFRTPSLLTGGPVSSPRLSQFLLNAKFNVHSSATDQALSGDCEHGPKISKSQTIPWNDLKSVDEVTFSSSNVIDDSCNKQERKDEDDLDLPESILEYILPDNLFASPTKVDAEKRSVFSHTSS